MLSNLNTPSYFAYKIDTSGLTSVLNGLLLDISNNTLNSDLYYSELIRNFIIINNQELINDTNYNLINGCINLLHISYTNTILDLKYLLLIIKINNDINSIQGLVLPYSTFINSSKLPSLNDMDHLNSQDNLLYKLFELSITNTNSNNPKASLVRLVEINKQIVNDNSIMDIIINVAGSNNYYSNIYIDYYLDTPYSKLILLLSTLNINLTELPKFSLEPTYLEFLNYVSNILDTKFSPIYSNIIAIINILTRLNLNNNIAHYNDILNHIQALYIINNLNIIMYNIDNVVTTTTNYSELNILLGKINNNLFNNLSNSEVNYLKSQLDLCINPDKSNLSGLSTSLRQVIYSIKPNVYPLVETSIDSSVTYFTNINNQIEAIDILARNTTARISDTINSINNYLKSILSIDPDIIEFLESLSKLTISLNIISDKLEDEICSLVNALCLANKIATYGISLVKEITRTSTDLYTKTTDILTSIKTSSVESTSFNIKGKINKVLTKSLADKKAADIAEVTSSLGSVIGAKLAAAYNGITSETLTNQVGVYNSVQGYLTSTLVELSNSIVASTVTKIGLCKGTASLPNIVFPTFIIPTISLPKLKVQHLKC